MERGKAEAQMLSSFACRVFISSSTTTYGKNECIRDFPASELWFYRKKCCMKMYFSIFLDVPRWLTKILSSLYTAIKNSRVNKLKYLFLIAEHQCFEHKNSALIARAISQSIKCHKPFFTTVLDQNNIFWRRLLLKRKLRKYVETEH